jgi:glycosyltransferase involved in cell wall biosynthesis
VVSSPIRVLQVIARMNVGGPASQVLALAEGLDPEEFRVEVLSGRPGVGEADFVELRAATAPLRVVEHLGPDISPVADARSLAAVMRAVRTYRPHVVHTHTAKAGLLGRAAARRFGVPTVHTFHGHLLHGYFGERATRAVVSVERGLARGTHQLLTVGEQVRDELLAAGIGSPDRYLAVPPGVPEIDVVEQGLARQELGLDPEAAVVAYVGRLTAVKRPDRLLDMLGSVRSRDRQVTLLIAGDGELREELESTAREGGLDVRFLGWRPDVGRIYGAADLAVLASDNEGMPVALIEAALCGRPAVATRAGSVPEVVDHERTGLVVDPDAEALAAAVVRLLDDHGGRVRMGAAAQHRARQRFSTAALVATTAEIYRRLAR